MHTALWVWASSAWATVGITEVMNNPLGDEARVEFVELFNGGPFGEDLTGWVLRDEDSDSLVLPSLWLDSGAYVVLTKDAAAFVAEWGVGAPGVDVIEVPLGNLANGDDELLLESAGGSSEWTMAWVDDEVEGYGTWLVGDVFYRNYWGEKAAPGVVRAGYDAGVFGLSGYEGGSVTADAAAFVSASGDVGSPLAGFYVPNGTVYDSPVPLQITEVMATPSAGRPTWFEVHNPTSAPVSLAGLVVATGYAPSQRWPMPAVSVPPYGTVIVTSDPAAWVAAWGLGVAGLDVIGDAALPPFGVIGDQQLRDAADRPVFGVGWDLTGRATAGFALHQTDITRRTDDFGAFGVRKVVPDGQDLSAYLSDGFESGRFTADLLAWASGGDEASPFATPFDATVLPGPTLSLAGSCGGAVTVSLSGLTPGGRFALVRSRASGEASVYAGGCAGTSLGLDGVGLRLLGVYASGGGAFTRTFTVPAGACGAWVQAVDLSTCGVSWAEEL